MAVPQPGVPWTSEEPDDLSVALGQANNHQEDIELFGEDEFSQIEPSAIGLGNVDNTSDATKPVSIPAASTFEMVDGLMARGRDIPAHSARTDTHGVQDTRDLVASVQLGYDSRLVTMSMPLWSAQTAHALTDGVLYLSELIPQQDWTIGKVLAAVGAVDVSECSLFRVGVYQRTGTQINLVAATTDIHATHFQTANSQESAPVVVPYSGLRGYSLLSGVLAVGASPEFYGAEAPFTCSTKGVRAARMYAPASPLTDLPASVNNSLLEPAPFYLLTGVTR